MKKKVRKCIVCGKTLGLFERLLGNTCSIKCQDTLKTSNGIKYSVSEYTDYPDIILDVPEIELHSLPVITANSIKNGGYTASAPMMYHNMIEENDVIDDIVDEPQNDILPYFFNADETYWNNEMYWNNEF